MFTITSLVTHNIFAMLFLTAHIKPKSCWSQYY